MIDSELRTLNSELKSQGEIKNEQIFRTTNYELRTPNEGNPDAS